MFSLFSYFAAIITAVAIILVTDDDPTQVSAVEWAMFGVTAYAANQLRIRLLEIYRRGSWE